MLNEIPYNDDKIFADLLRKGDVNAFEHLYSTYFNSLNRFSYHIVLCDNSHDIVQEVFTKLWVIRKKLPYDINLKSYLYTSVKNGSLNYLKHLNIVDDKRELIIEATLFVEDSWANDDNELLERVEKLIDTLPSQQQKVIKLKFEGRSYKEISEEMNISVKTVNNHIVKAYTFIREVIAIIILLLFFSK